MPSAPPGSPVAPPKVQRTAESDAGDADEPPSLQALLELGSVTVAGQSSPPPPEPTPGIAEIEGFPISERPGAMQDFFAAGEPAAARAAAAAERSAASGAVQSAPPVPQPRPGRTTLPFGAPAFSAPAFQPPALQPPTLQPPALQPLASGVPAPGAPALQPMLPSAAPELGGSPLAARPAPLDAPPTYGVVPEAGTTTPYEGPTWASPQVSGIRWGLVLLIILGLGGVAAVWIGLEVMGRGPVAVAPKDTEAVPSLPLQGTDLDDAAFEALRTRAHAFGAVESPALRALLDAEAGALRHATTPTCAAGSVGCLLSPDGGERSHYRPLADVSREKPGASSAWLANLRLPGIGVAGDPRVRALFEFHTQHPVGREMFQGTLFQCGAHQALIREVLIRHDVPLDLSALAMVASGCGADVESPTGARGLWQVSPLTARAYDLLIIPGVIDERLDPAKSTAAAIRFLADLRTKTGSWELAAASFGVGPFELLARLVRAGAQADFWRIADADPLLGETAGFVAKVQAYALILSNLDRYHFQDPPPRPPEMTEPVDVPAGTRLGLIARAAGTSTTRIRELNPELLGSSVPTEPRASFIIRVPQTGAQRARDHLPGLISDADGAEQCVPHHFDWGRQRFTRNMASRCQETSR